MLLFSPIRLFPFLLFSGVFTFPISAQETAVPSTNPPASASPAPTTSIEKSPIGILLLPNEVTLAVARGERTTGAFDVANSGTDPLFLRVEAKDFAVSSGKIVEGNANSSPQSAASWLQFNPQQFALEPGKSIRVRYSFVPPADFTREHRAIVFFTSRPVPIQNAQNQTVMASGRAGALLYIAPKSLFPTRKRLDPLTQTTVEEPNWGALNANRQIAIQGATLGDDRQTVTVKFKNTGPLSYRIGTAEIEFRQGENVVARAQRSRALLLSGAEITVSFRLPAPLAPGEYLARIVAEIGAPTRTGVETRITVGAPKENTPETPVVALSNAGAGGTP